MFELVEYANESQNKVFVPMGFSCQPMDGLIVQITNCSSDFDNALRNSYEGIKFFLLCHVEAFA